MSASIAVVTDSTSYLPLGMAGAHAIEVVPLQVQLGDHTGYEGSEISPGQVAAALAARLPVHTSQPGPAQFLQTYERLLGEADGVVSVHISSGLSGTTNTARLAARQLDVGRIRVVDSRSVAMGLGFAVLAAADCAAAGGSLEEVAEKADRTARRARLLFYVDTLDHLRRGGRIGSRSAMLGTALSVKVIMHLVGGKIELLEKVRTSGRARARLGDLAVDLAGRDDVEIAVHHLGAPERAAELERRLRQGVPGLERLVTSELGAVIGAHTGPGVLGVVVARR